VNGLAVDPATKYLYGTQGDVVVGFTIGATGALTPIAGSPFNSGGSNTPITSAPSVVDRGEISAEETTQDDSRPPEVLALCARQLRHSALDPVEGALAVALVEAAIAGRFDVVGQLARELEARRLDRRPR
jgi:hypothetical protein